MQSPRSVPIRFQHRDPKIDVSFQLKKMYPAKIDLWHPSFIFFQNAFSFWIPRNLTICSCGPKQPWVWCDIGWPFSPASASSCRFRMMCHGSLLKFIVYHGFTIDFTTENNWEYASQLISITLSPESYWSGCGVGAMVCYWNDLTVTAAA